MVEAAGWYLALLFVGGAGLLPAALLFERLPSAGVLIARPVALAVASLLAWLASAFGLVPYGTPLAVGAVLVLYAWSGAIAWRGPQLLDVLLARRRWLLAGEAVFLVVFALVTLARAQAPDAVGTEKPMDLMLVTAIHEADRLPPPDPWLAGRPISYYHLGHVGADLVGRLSGNPPRVAVTLVVASAGAMAAAAVAGLAVDIAALVGLRRRRGWLVAGGTALFTLLLAAPLVGIGLLASANGLGSAAFWQGLGIPDAVIAEGATRGIPNAWWWWWTNTRVLPGTITEFPAFTLLLGDPHAHLLALPYDLAAVALALVVFEGTTPLTWRRWLHAASMGPERLALTALLFAAIFLTNAWDVVIFGGLWGLAAIVAFRRTGWSWLVGAIGVARWAAIPAGVALVLSWPFLDTADSPQLGLAAVLGEHSDPARWLLVWLPPLLPVLGALALLRPRAEGAAIERAMLLALAPVFAWAIALGVTGHASELLARDSGWITIGALALAGAYAAALAGAADRRGDIGLAAALGMLTFVVIVLGATELVRVADAFPGRMNTVFKFWFACWVLLAVAAGALAGLAAERAVLPESRGLRLALVEGLLVGGALLVLSALYVPAMTVGRMREGQTAGVDALAYLERADPGLAATIEWSRIHLDPREDVVVQAIAESYSGGNLLAAASGVPTLIGWPNHERQWRGDVPEQQRRAEVEMLYQAGATAENAALAHRAGVTHVYIGREERARYGADLAARFAGWPVAFAHADAQLVQVP